MPEIVVNRQPVNEYNRIQTMNDMSLLVKRRVRRLFLRRKRLEINKVRRGHWEKVDRTQSQRRLLLRFVWI
jgi:hypothetical protein